jgi:hypothetical protein
MRAPTLILLVLAVALAAALASAPARALTIVSHVEHYDAGSDAFQFAITFSVAPEFYVFDEFGRHKDEFQYFITWVLHPENTSYPIFNADVVIRMPESASVTDIRVRDATGPEEPGSGGWGPIRGSVPYVLDGATITFQIPRTMLGDSDGVVSYALLIGTYGTTTDERKGISDNGPVAAVRGTWGGIKALYL